VAAIVVIGDELNVAGFRLAGVDTRSPAPGETGAVFADALASSALVVLSRRSADALPADMLRRALGRESPLVVVMPDIAAPAPDAAFVRRMKAVLGIEA
jgi:vacuolar-type H+-ATPase subunit F/Vma7